MVAALRQLELRSPAFALAFVASLGVSVGAILTTYLAMKLFAPTTPLLAVAIGFPMLVVASLLPGSVAGFGGNQVAAAAVFGALSLDPKAAVLSSFLVSTLNLVTTSVAGVMWLPHAWHEHARGGVDDDRERELNSHFLSCRGYSSRITYKGLRTTSA